MGLSESFAVLCKVRGGTASAGAPVVVLSARMCSRGPQLSPLTTASNDLQMKLTDEPNEVFAVVFLDTTFQVVAYEHIFNVHRQQHQRLPCVVPTSAWSFTPAPSL